MAEIALHARWDGPEQARANFLQRVAPWCIQQWEAGRRLEVFVRLHEDAKTDRQRVFYHDFVLAEIARQAVILGHRHSKNAWKEHFRTEYLGSRTVTHEDPISGKITVVQERISTESLGVREYGDLIDRVMAHAIDDLKVEFPATFEEWEREQTHPDTGEVIGGVCP